MLKDTRFELLETVLFAQSDSRVSDFFGRSVMILGGVMRETSFFAYNDSKQSPDSSVRR